MNGQPTAHDAVQQALYRLGDHYNPTSAEQNVLDADALIEAIEDAGFMIVRASA